ncbi:hypothetical protein CcI49_03040 [Frankia sp. CcI49]|uniref:RapZ C-terminal domain-containing protein n=1 Tax=Frankia sp. CcI49 TaxID=1745382 RepID=UPI0006CA5CF2|nr:RNase adapter RapZ [Frankia sp. CcI49]KPM55690.1 hypothetical protein ACG83_10420 [Frankia sp. R43]ONH62369.1 hypothetical protein CcI49_03040 [Frankia sp. CcI49]
MTRYQITSGGYLHGDPGETDIEVDLRPYRDPHAAANLRYLTAHDQEVQDAVRGTPGVTDLVDETVARALALDEDEVTITSFCAGGRHRGPVAGEMIADGLRAAGGEVDLFHRDLGKAVVERAVREVDR